MAKHGQQEAAEQFAAAHPLSKSADYKKKFAWSKSQCEFLSENCDADTVKAVRMDCACGPQHGAVAKLAGLYKKADSLQAFADTVNSLGIGFTLEYDGTALYLIYPECYCSCVKRVDEKLPESWCYCTLGYSKRMFSGILDREVQVELVTSVKTGGDHCRIKIISQ